MWISDFNNVFQIYNACFVYVCARSLTIGSSFYQVGQPVAERRLNHVVLVFMITKRLGNRQLLEENVRNSWFLQDVPVMLCNALLLAMSTKLATTNWQPLQGADDSNNSGVVTWTQR